MIQHMDVGLIEATGHGLRRYTGYGMGMAYRYGLHPMRCYEHG